MRIKAEYTNRILYFDNFAVRKDSDNFYGVYCVNRREKEIYGDVITSGISMKDASQKAKLLQIGYNMGLEIQS